MTRPPLIRTRTDDKGRLWTLDGDRWTAAPDLVVTTSGQGKDRDFSPGRDPGLRYGALSVACEAEVRIAEAQRERVIAEMERIRAEERRCAAPKGPDVILPRWSPPASVLALCGVAGVAWLLVCAGIVGWAL